MAAWYGISSLCLTLYLTSENSRSTRTHVLSSMYCSLYSIQLSWLEKIWEKDFTFVILALLGNSKFIFEYIPALKWWY